MKKKKNDFLPFTDLDPSEGKTHKTSDPRIPNLIDDGFNSELVEGAVFDGILEIPRISAPEKIILPGDMIPFSARNQSFDYSEVLVFYEYDVNFSNILRCPSAYIGDFKRFQGIVSPDNSLYRDMPLCAQMCNVYRNRAIGHYYQKHGINVITNVRWGDERSYTTKVFPEKFAFLGAPKNSILAIGTYGCTQGEENEYHLRAGLEAMMEELTPKVVLVYGPMPNEIFSPYDDVCFFVPYEDWLSRVKKHRR